MQVFIKNIAEIIPYDKNPRKNDSAVAAVAASIKEFGFRVPIVIDGEGVIVAGHTRYKAALQLNIQHIPCVVVENLTPDQVKAFRLADNKTVEIADWDTDLLNAELGALDGLIDMSLFGFDLTGEGEKVNPYTASINVPQYEVTGEDVSLMDLVDSSKTDAFENRIHSLNVTDEQKAFLLRAARRHDVFDYHMIAEYYAKQDETMQNIMEDLALVIIDYDSAIANGYTKLSGDIKDMFEGDAP